MANHLNELANALMMAAIVSSLLDKQRRPAAANYFSELARACTICAMISSLLAQRRRLAAIDARAGISDWFGISSKVQENETIVLLVWAKSTYFN